MFNKTSLTAACRSLKEHRKSGSNSRLALIRDDQGSIVVDADLSALGPNLTILGGMEKGEALVGADYRDRPDFWRLS